MYDKCTSGVFVYAYSPYGESISLGADDGNSIQYTGRENDGTGLYYYRARYYDPVLKRFVSEDPIGMTAGPNLYQFVRGDPVRFRDPLGTDVVLDNAMRAAGLAPVRPMKLPPALCFATCMAAKGVVSVGISAGVGGAGAAIGGRVGALIIRANSMESGVGGSVVIGSELAAYDFCVRECPGYEPAACNINLGDIQAP